MAAPFQRFGNVYKDGSIAYGLKYEIVGVLGFLGPHANF
ncbi:MAG TPA: hypothetical protein [Caudoviricetes sp.]|nr:MAG TPA: hypothetical protein [Caudoviricetes sp.]